MSKNKKILLGILSCWPVVYIFLFLFFVFVIAFPFAINQDASNENTFPPIFILIFALHIFTIITSIILFFYYLYHIYKNKHMTNELKWIWGAGIFFAGLIVYPFYWYLHVWKGPTKK